MELGRLQITPGRTLRRYGWNTRAHFPIITSPITTFRDAPFYTPGLILATPAAFLQAFYSSAFTAIPVIWFLLAILRFPCRTFVQSSHTFAEHIHATARARRAAVRIPPAAFAARLHLDWDTFCPYPSRAFRRLPFTVYAACSLFHCRLGYQPATSDYLFSLRFLSLPRTAFTHYCHFRAYISRTGPPQRVGSGYYVAYYYRRFRFPPSFAAWAGSPVHIWFFYAIYTTCNACFTL